MTSLMYVVAVLAAHYEQLGFGASAESMAVRIQRAGEIAFKERSGLSQMVSVSGLIGMVILIFVAAALLPDAITEIEDANTTGWDSSAVALWGIIGIVIVAAFIVGIWNFTR